jgi:hypothetical protein
MRTTLMEAPRSSTKNIVRLVLGVALLLLVPLVAMQFTDEVNWNLVDFATIGALLIGTGLVYELAARKLKSSTHRAVLAIVLVAAVLLVWAELSVGILGTPFAGS